MNLHAPSNTQVLHLAGKNFHTTACGVQHTVERCAVNDGLNGPHLVGTWQMLCQLANNKNQGIVHQSTIATPTSQHLVHVRNAQVNHQCEARSLLCLYLEKCLRRVQNVETHLQGIPHMEQHQGQSQ